MEIIHPDSTICQIESFLKLFCEDSMTKNISNSNQSRSKNPKVCSCSKFTYLGPKITNDDSVAVTLIGGFRVYSPELGSSRLYCCPVEIEFMDISPKKGEYIASSGKTESDKSTSWIWKYTSLHKNNQILPYKLNIKYRILQLHNSAAPKFSRSDKCIFAVSSTRNVQMFDVETSSLILKFSESNTDSFYFVNSIDTNNNDTLLSFNGDIFCTRSSKLIHKFERFNIMKSGKFMPSDTELLIDCQLWDLRTLKLIINIDKFSRVIINRTDYDDILYGS
ncbi:hypothetical protein MXB_3020 [Myxobolus squamalis]|nr:hypothetical protein MXB_3020 [Myxobolus squamalis]